MILHFKKFFGGNILIFIAVGVSQMQQLVIQFLLFDWFTGFAFIYMEDERDAEDAIRALDRREFGRKGRRLRVEWTKVMYIDMACFQFSFHSFGELLFDFIYYTFKLYLAP